MRSGWTNGSGARGWSGRESEPARLIEAGKVRINGVRVLKPSRLVHPGDVVTATSLGRLTVVRVLGSTERRGPASVAARSMRT